MNGTAAARRLLSPTLNQTIDQVLIIAYKESTQDLEEFFGREGFSCDVIRQLDQPEFQGFSRSYLCLLNHCRAWQRASCEPKPTLIIEADFVPVVQLGKLPLPCDPSRTDLGIAWLYTCAPQIYSVSKDGYIEGFSTAMVAYIVTPESAQCLIEFGESIQQTQQATDYSSWDSTIEQFLRLQKLKNYIPFRNYGEHGGYPNPEHRQHGLNPSHRADVLYGKLAFLPAYAIANSKSHPLPYLWVRLQARLKGIGRLVMGRFLRLKVLRETSDPLRLLSCAIRRQFSLPL
ncbi:MAG: hypothetical protein Kow00121_68560 [Elainellaceae cyanobacterium]